MRQEWSSDELVATWTLVDEDWLLVANKAGATRLGFALLLKFFEVEARFPQHAAEVPSAAVAYVARGRRARSSTTASSSATRSGSEFTRSDKDKLAVWLAEEVCPVEFGDDALHEAELVRCRTERLEPPGRIGRIIGAARSAFETRFCGRTAARLDEATTARLLGLLDVVTLDVVDVARRVVADRQDRYRRSGQVGDLEFVGVAVGVGADDGVEVSASIGIGRCSLLRGRRSSRRSPGRRSPMGVRRGSLSLGVERSGRTSPGW